MALITSWQSDPATDKKISQNQLHKLSLTFEVYLDSDLFGTVQAADRESGMADEPEHLYLQFKKRLEKLKVQKREIVSEPVSFKDQSPRQKELNYQYKFHLELAEVYRRKNQEKEIEALYDTLLYLIALINQSTEPEDIEEYRKDLFALYSTIAAFYERSEEFEKAIEVYKKASFLFSTMDLKKPDDWPSHWKEVFDALSSLYTQLGNTASANHNRFLKEQFSRQREQAEKDL